MSTSRYSPVRERIAHTQQRQISERAPRPLTAMNGKKTAKKKQRPLLIELFDILPARWKGITLGLLLSLAPSYLISLNTTGMRACRPSRRFLALFWLASSSALSSKIPPTTRRTLFPRS
ncbi:MAG: hypothetical protein IPK17_14025 [Chloroflexi bacterium]|uniref:hypothetical protein n=1 Tax=Candidatus Flexifilum breve TaxID=3140694 RepID=UPI003137374B|nr:hypothetical protein [Chloroflexota bacterium]